MKSNCTDDCGGLKVTPKEGHKTLSTYEKAAKLNYCSDAAFNHNAVTHNSMCDDEVARCDVSMGGMDCCWICC